MKNNHQEVAQLIFLLSTNVSLNIYQVAQERTQTKDVVCCCCACGTVSCTLRANKKGYVPGENILMSAEIKNGTKTTVDYCTVALKQVVYTFIFASALAKYLMMFIYAN